MSIVYDLFALENFFETSFSGIPADQLEKFHSRKDIQKACDKGLIERRCVYCNCKETPSYFIYALSDKGRRSCEKDSFNDYTGE